jgi:hypothetical protein
MPALSKNSLSAVVLFTALVGCGLIYLGTVVVKEYALGLFVLLPFVLGAVSTLLLARVDSNFSRSQARRAAGLSLLVCCIGLLAFAFEGVICIIMAAPIGWLLAICGHALAFEFVKHKGTGSVPTAVLMLLLAVPSLMAFEHASPIPVQLRAVRTSIDIAAPAAQVWQQVVAFPQLPTPTEFIFRTGIAYPINATIAGRGVGAVRRCNFSTGSFVEPITTWDEPHRLAFSVADQPAPMRELSPYDHLQPNHLHGFFVSKRGQFLLTALPNGHTRLEGTTWYYNRIQPDLYWSLWSDYIVHRIHARVLAHIKQQSETRPVAAN